jgi:hypothetical protein
MNVATGNRVTAQDLVRVEKLEAQVGVLELAAQEVVASIHNLRTDQLASAKRCISTGTKVFAKEEDTPAQELEREIALLRARLQCELWEGWWTEVEQELAKLNAAFVEFRATKSLASVLDCCSD